MIGIELFFKGLATCMKMAQKSMEISLKIMESFTKIPEMSSPSKKASQVAGEKTPPKEEDLEPSVATKIKPSDEPLKEEASKTSYEPTVKPPKETPETPALKAGSEAIAKSEQKAMEKKVKRKSAPEKTDQSDSAVKQIMDVISSNKQGVKSAEIREATGFEAKKVQNIVYRLKKQGKVKTVKKGVYAKA